MSAVLAGHSSRVRPVSTADLEAVMDIERCGYGFP